MFYVIKLFLKSEMTKDNAEKSLSNKGVNLEKTTVYTFGGFSVEVNFSSLNISSFCCLSFV